MKIKKKRYLHGVGTLFFVQYTQKRFSHWTSTNKIWVEIPVPGIQHIGNRKRFWVLSHLDQASHLACSCSFISIIIA